MTPERWQRIEELYHDALTRDPADRAAFLATACAGDDDLRHEVESLLQQAPTADGVLQTPPLDVAHVMARAGAVLDGARQVGPYQLVALVGAGGMGDVYRARDLKLGRDVAVKLLSADVADAAGRRRFQREAQMASSLNHPHILTVHDAGEVDGRQYLVTELVDGGTLRDWAHAEPRTWRPIVELLVGVADGLAAAHAAGILHRDVKPENILVTRSGYAKLADFGLAKLHETSDRETTQAATRAGVVVGTIPYMSPEQAASRPLDARSDIFSFGVVLYELLAGRKPFAGDSDLATLQTIATATPPPLENSLPAALRNAVDKMLEKDPADRYQTMRDLVVDLRRLVRQSGENVTPSAVRPRSWTRAAAAALVLLALAAAGVRLFRSSPAPGRTYTQVTDFTDSAVAPALSADGRLLAFIRGNRHFLSPDQIWVKLLPNGEPIQVTNGQGAKLAPVFSPDGSELAYSVVDTTGWHTYTVPSLGGPSRLLLRNASGLTWLSEKRLLFSAQKPGLMHMGIVSTAQSGAEARDVYWPTHTRAMAHYSWASPDQQWALVVEMDQQPDWLPCRLVPLDGNSRGRQVGPRGPCMSAAWSPDGAWMYLSVAVDGQQQVWRQRFPDGTPEQITFGPTEASGIAVDPDGRSLITSLGLTQSVLWLRDERGDRAVSTEGLVFSLDSGDATETLLGWSSVPSFSPDGRYVYYLLRRPSSDAGYRLWRTDAKSGSSENVLQDPSIIEYDLSQDGREVVFSTGTSTGHAQIWVAPVDRSSPPRRIAEGDVASPHFTKDGVVFRLTEGNVNYLFRMNRDGSGVRKAVPYAINTILASSSDGRWVAALLEDGDSFLVPTEGGPPMRLCASSCRVQWGPDDKVLHVTLELPSRARPGMELAIPLGPGGALPAFPESGLTSGSTMTGARVVDSEMIPGPDPSTYAYVKTTVNRNLYRVPLP
jgi:serine/threonine protein kinase